MQRIALQEVRDSLLGWGVYITTSAGLLLTVLLLYNSVRFVRESGLEILSRPFLSPVQAALTVAILYVTVGVALVIARPREQGALQILFFAPVDAVILVGAHFVSGVLIYAIQALILVPLVVLLALLTNVFFPPAIVGGVLLSLTVAGLAVAFGLFLSAVAPSSPSCRIPAKPRVVGASGGAEKCRRTSACSPASGSATSVTRKIGDWHSGTGSSSSG